EQGAVRAAQFQYGAVVCEGIDGTALPTERHPAHLPLAAPPIAARLVVEAAVPPGADAPEALAFWTCVCLHHGDVPEDDASVGLAGHDEAPVRRDRRVFHLAPQGALLPWAVAGPLLHLRVAGALALLPRLLG